VRPRISAAAVASLILVLLAAGLRILPQWRGVVEGGVAIASDPDACYQLRRADLIAKNFPDLAIFDSYINYPSGAWVIWPPLYALALAGGVAAFPASAHAPAGTSAGGATSAAAPLSAGGCSIPVALLPPLLFAATILALFVVARRLWPARLDLAILAAGLPALSPASVLYTIVGQMDHHAAEILIVALFVLALGDAAGGARAGGRADDMRAGRSSARRAVWPGIVLAAGILVQLTLVLLIPIAFAALLLGAWFDDRPARARAFELLAWLHAIAAALVLPFALAYHAAGAPFRHFQFGMFHAALLALASLAATAAWALIAGPMTALAPSAPLLFVPPLPARRIGRIPRIPLLLVSGGLAALLAVRLAPEIVGGVGYVGKTFSTWQASIQESRSLLRDGPWAGLSEAIRSFSVLVVLFPLGLAAIAWRLPSKNAWIAPLVVSATIFAALGVMQMRFLAHASLFVGFAAAAALELLLARAPAKRLRPALVACGALAALVPTISVWHPRNYATDGPGSTRSVLASLARETPPTSHYDHPNQRPEYGVVAEWSLGHLIEYHGRRPTLVDNFGAHIGDPTRVNALFFETDEARAMAFLDSTGGRYVLIRDLISTLTGLAPSDSLKSRLIASMTRVGAGAGASTGADAQHFQFKPEMFRTILYRLAWYDGTLLHGPSGLEIPPLSHFCLIAESEKTDPIEDGRAVPRAKLFEIVRGARIRFEGFAPGVGGLLSVSVRSPRGRMFPYSAAVTADSLGAMELTLPYPTVARDGMSFAEQCEIRVGAATFAISGVTGQMVRDGEGMVIAVSSAPAPPPAPPPANPR